MRTVEPIFKVKTGDYKKMEETLKRTIGQYIRHSKECKIGITNDPYVRWNSYISANTRYNEMIVFYKTSSYSYICEVEKYLIDHAKDYVDNQGIL